MIVQMVINYNLWQGYTTFCGLTYIRGVKMNLKQQVNLSHHINWQLTKK